MSNGAAPFTLTLAMSERVCGEPAHQEGLPCTDVKSKNTEYWLAWQRWTLPPDQLQSKLSREKKKTEVDFGL